MIRRHITRTRTARVVPPTCRRHSRIRLLIVFPLLLTATASPERFEFSRPLMGTKFAIVCYAVNENTAETAADAAFQAGERVNAVASDYDPESELMRLRKADAGAPVELSPLLFDLLSHARTIAERTDGAYDPTLGPLTRLWRESRKTKSRPDEETLAAAKSRTGWHHVTLDPEARTITHEIEGMAFDLGGIAKGYAADLMLAAMKDHDVSRCLIAAGGDIRLGDAPPGRYGWNVALRTFDRDEPDEVLELADCAVSTSGDLHQFVVIDGTRYSHILDPESGLGLTDRIAVSVIAPSAKLTDPLATATCVAGADKAPGLLDKFAPVDFRIRRP